MNPAFKQIGNAVPPLFAYSIAMAMRSFVGCQPINDIRCELLGLDERLVTTTAGKERKCAF
jgi:DNA (cytosine-5)-methyltransferase 1